MSKLASSTPSFALTTYAARSPFLARPQARAAGVQPSSMPAAGYLRGVAFLGSAAGGGGWRVAIVDAVDELQREGANALLKVLEEPPQRSLIMLVRHSPARGLP